MFGEDENVSCVRLLLNEIFFLFSFYLSSLTYFTNVIHSCVCA